MKLTLWREHLAEGWTLGHMWVDGKSIGYTCEDRDRLHRGEPKVPGETAIKAGTYIVTVTYSPAFDRLLPRLADVPDFQGVLIHRGNSAKDSRGCILVGLDWYPELGRIGRSTAAEVWLTKAVQSAGSATIEITHARPVGME